MWIRRPQLQRLLNLQKVLRNFFSSDGRIQKPKLSYPGGSDKIGAYGYFLLTIPAVTFGLGTWQIHRWQWKLDLIKSLLEKTKADPVELPHDLSELTSLEYKPVRVRGSYDHSRELYIGPRSQIVQGGDEELGRSGLLSTGRTGVQVVTPFQLADSDMEILVNRGWVPMAKMDPSTRAKGQIEGEHEIVGVVRITEKRTQFMPANTTSKKNLYLYRDVKLLSGVAGTAPVFLDLTVECAPPGAPAAGQTRVTLRNEHLSYIATWYCLSAFTSVMWYRRFVVLPRIRAEALGRLR
ncbi:surfeit locus protein 1-like [Pollicipes pollicipes]|uniref:surfeit locus protein 1-like n=1 Tax=Pollicipes pollicipes TaxID=41117 RepID=UPI001884B158|nr:surfeit locus protein 1-like [Pollicipes pollicipes]XP_037080160.1 surfeit locus protein 1-like [Pollicipes pollicipes]